MWKQIKNCRMVISYMQKHRKLNKLTVFTA